MSVVKLVHASQTTVAVFGDVARPGKIEAELRRALVFGNCIDLELPREIGTVARL